MSTPYNLVFEAFTSKIKDNLFLELPQFDAEDQMISILNDALIYFKYPKVNILDKNDEAKIFNVDLGYEEIQITSHLMVSAWLDRQINNIELIKQKFTDRDFKITSQAEHLDKLIKLRDRQEARCKTLMKSYYNKNGSKANYSNLASDNI
jgi:hypothetical protein